MANKLLKSLTIDGQTFDAIAPEWVNPSGQTKSVASGDTVYFNVFTATKKCNVIGNIQAGFQANATGVRFMWAGREESASTALVSSRTSAAPTGQTALITPIEIVLEAGESIFAGVMHTAGTALNVNVDFDGFSFDR